VKNEFLAIEDDDDNIPNINDGKQRYDDDDIFVKAYNETREHGA
jgi:hypothetical protein